MKNPPRYVRLEVEQLEDRTTPSGGIASASGALPDTYQAESNAVIQHPQETPNPIDVMTLAGKDEYFRLLGEGQVSDLIAPTQVGDISVSPETAEWLASYKGGPFGVDQVTGMPKRE